MLETRLEDICERGCQQVWDVIATLERGGEMPETCDLDAAERDWLLAELKTVMAVYGERCRIG